MTQGRGRAPELLRAAHEGDLDAVARFLIDGEPIDSVNRSGSTALHLALQRQQLDIARLLISEKADVNTQSNNLVTPLMVAASCCSAMVPELLRAGANPWALNEKKQRARQICQRQGYLAAERLLEEAEQQCGNGEIEVAAAAEQRCPECGEVVNLSRLRRIENKVACGDEDNAYVTEFVNHPSVFRALESDPAYHRCLNNKKLRKEVSETWAVITAVQRIVARAELRADDLQFVDLCCGKSLTSSLLALLYPGARVVAVDVVDEASVPHFRPPVKYLQANIYASGFADQLRAQLHEAGPVVICGMHLCGGLSPCAVELAQRLPGTVGLVLSPCCMPSKKLYDNAALSGSRDQRTQYDHWCASLAEYIALATQQPWRVEYHQDEAVLSTKNGLVVASRSGVSSSPGAPTGSGATDLTDELVCPEAGPPATGMHRPGHPLFQLTKAMRAHADEALRSNASMLNKRAENRDWRAQRDLVCNEAVL